VAEVCQLVAFRIQERTALITGRTPTVNVEAFSAAGRDEDGIPRLSYVPFFLRYILEEILKNSCRATVEVVKTSRELSKRPISIVVCADESRVAIRVADRAGGIPADVGKRVWSYLYTTATQGAKYGEAATALAGFGVGLPLSRLYARYLGGKLNLVSLPGCGTAVHIFLPRMQAEQIEVVPDDDNPVEAETS